MALSYKTANDELTRITRYAYLGLSTTTPTRDGGNITEPPKEAGYSRVEIYGKLGTASNGFIQNDAVIYFPEAIGNWGNCTHYVLFSALNDGEMIAYGALDNPISPVDGKLPIIPVNSIRLSLS